MRPVRSLIAAFAALLAACNEPTRSGDAITDGVQPVATTTAAITPGTCTTPAEVSALINTVFGPGSPDARSVQGKFNNLDKQVKKGNFAEARAQAYNLVDFFLKKYRQGGLPGTPEQAGRLASLFFCYSGLDFVVEDPSSSFVVGANNAEQVLPSGDNQAGVQLKTNTLIETTLIQVVKVDPSSLPGSALNTKLDQYAGYYHVKKNSDTDAPLTQPVVVGVCPEAGIPADVLARLRLGHNATFGFEITPPASADFLNCSSTASLSGWKRLLKQVAGVFTPKELHAAALIGGGVGGLASEFSIFGPIDPVVSLTGGVGGLPSEFLRSEGSLTAAACEGGVQAPIGTQVPPECRPTITVTTRLGTVLSGVPVSFSVLSGGGSVAQELSTSCGTFSPSVVANTDLAGRSRACWTLGGTAGLNQVKATAAVGGDVPSGITFSPAPSFTFSATANPPVALRFVQQPAEGSTLSRESPVTVHVAAVDVNDVVVEGFSGVIALHLTPFSFGTHSANAVRGVATFSYVITQPFTGYRFVAEAAFSGPTVSVTGNSFSVSSP